MDYIHANTGSSGPLKHRVERIEKRLDALVKAVDALVRQLELSDTLDEASSGVRLALTKASRTEQP